MKKIFTFLVILWSSHSGFSQKKLVGQISNGRDYVLFKSDNLLDFAFIEATGSESLGTKDKRFILFKNGQLEEIGRKYPFFRNMGRFNPMVDPITQSFFQRAQIDNKLRHFLFSKDLELKNFDLEPDGNDIRRFFNNHVYVVSNDTLRKIDVRQLNRSSTEFTVVPPFYQIIEIKDSLVFLGSSRDSTIILKNYKDQLLHSFKVKSHPGYKIYPSKSGIYFFQLSGGNTSIWVFDMNGARVVADNVEGGFNHFDDQLYFSTADSVISYSDGNRTSMARTGDHTLLYSKKESIGCLQSEDGSIIFDDSVSFYFRRNIRSDSIQNGKLETGLYAINLRSGKVSQITFNNLPLYVYSLVNVNNRCFALAATPHNDIQVVELDYRTGKAIIRSDFKGGYYRLELHKVGNSLFCTKSISKTRTIEIWKIDTEIEYPEREHHWANAIITLSGYSNPFAGAQAVHCDEKGNFYTLAMANNLGSHLSANTNNEKEIVGEPFNRFNYSGGSLILQKFRKNGDKVWTQQFVGRLSLWGSLPASSYIKTDNAGNVYLSGTASHNLKIGPYDFSTYQSSPEIWAFGFIAKFDSNGTFKDLYPKRFTADTWLTAFELDTGQNMYCAIEARRNYEFQGVNIVAEGYATPFVKFHKMDASGKLLWSMEYDFSTKGHFTGTVEKLIWNKASNHLFALVKGRLKNSSYSRDSDFPIHASKMICIDPENGKVLWSRLFSSFDFLEVHDFTTTPFNTLHVVGRFSQELLFEGKVVLKSDAKEGQGFWVRIDEQTGALKGASIFHRDRTFPIRITTDKDGRFFTTAVNYSEETSTTWKWVPKMYYDSYGRTGNLLGSYSYVKTNDPSSAHMYIRSLISHVVDRKVLVGDVASGSIGEGFSFGSPFRFILSNAVFYLLDFDKTESSTSPSESMGSKVFVYPNPSFDWFFFINEELKGLKKCKLKLYSTDGKRVANIAIPVHNGQAEYQSRDLPKGLYMGFLETDSGYRKSIKIVKQ